MGASISMEQGELDYQINYGFSQTVAKPSDSNLVQNVEEHAMEKTLTIPQPKDFALTRIDTSLEKTYPLVTNFSYAFFGFLLFCFIA